MIDARLVGPLIAVAVAKVVRESASPQARGGLARSANLTPARRSEIARQAAFARWSKKRGAKSPVNRIPEKPGRGQTVYKKQGKKMAEKISKTHAQAIEAMKDQLLIVLIDRAGGECAIHVDEIDGTGDRNLIMSLDRDWFHFAVRRKSGSAPDIGSINISKRKPDYDEH
jgi:hypothetical protein